MRRQETRAGSRTARLGARGDVLDPDVIVLGGGSQRRALLRDGAAAHQSRMSSATEF